MKRVVDDPPLPLEPAAGSSAQPAQETLSPGPGPRPVAAHNGPFGSAWTVGQRITAQVQLVGLTGQTAVRGQEPAGQRGRPDLDQRSGRSGTARRSGREPRRYRRLLSISPHYSRHVRTVAGRAALHTYAHLREAETGGLGRSSGRSLAWCRGCRAAIVAAGGSRGLVTGAW